MPTPLQADMAYAILLRDGASSVQEQQILFLNNTQPVPPNMQGPPLPNQLELDAADVASGASLSNLFNGTTAFGVPIDTFGGLNLAPQDPSISMYSVDETQADLNYAQQYGLGGLYLDQDNLPPGFVPPP